MKPPTPSPQELIMTMSEAGTTKTRPMASHRKAVTKLTATGTDAREGIAG